MAYSDEVLADSPILYWRLDEASDSLLDSSGNNNHPTSMAYNEDTQVAGLVTEVGTFALSFLGEVSRYPLVSSSGDITVELWVKIPSGFAGNANLFKDWGASAVRNWQIYLDGSNQINFITSNGAGGTHNIATTVAYNDDTTHHVVAVVSGTSSVLYVDGASAATGSAYTSRGTGKDEPILGSYSSLAIVYDDVAVYLSALSGTRVLAHYNAGRSLTITAEATEGLGFSSTFSALLTVPRTITNTIQFESVSSSARRFMPIIIEALAFTPALSVSGRFRVTLVDTIAFVSPLDIDADEAWVINLNTRAVCRYIDYGYSSFCRSKDKYYASLGKKLYTLDGTQAIDASAIFGKTEVADGQQTRAAAVYLGADSDDFMYVKVVTREDTEYVYKARAYRAFLHPVRVDLGKALRARSWELEVYNSNGAAAEIQSLGVLYEPTKRRI